MELCLGNDDRDKEEMRAAVKGFWGIRGEGDRADGAMGDQEYLYDEKDLMASDEMVLRRKQRRREVNHIEGRGGNC